jgi:sugar/nucleoside kinase (ribokinase family)
MSFEKNIDVLGLGAVAVDFVGTVDLWPAEGTKLPLKGLSLCDGGLAGTALAAVARLGGKASFVGKLGFSDMAKRAVKAFEKEGVDTSYVIREENCDPIVSLIIANTTNGHRNIFWTMQNVQYPLPSEFPDRQWVSKTKVLFVDFSTGEAGVEAAEIASENSIPVVVDVERDAPHVPRLLAACSHVVLSEDFAANYTGTADMPEICKRLRTSALQTIIITRGAKGCAALTSEGFFELPAFKVNVVDTTGCGDVFHGAYALAIARGKTVRQAATFASAAAGLCATKIGGRDGIPTDQELQAFIKSHFDTKEIR